MLSGRIYIRVEKAGNETTVARIGEILNNTIDFKSKVQLRAEVMADRTVAPTLLLSGVSLPVMGPSVALGILQSHFHNRMKIVAPVSILSYFSLLSKNGILIKDGRTLDLLNDVDTIVFDKTGTLTQEQPHVGSIHSCSEYPENEVLTYAAAAEQKQKHPIARAVLEEANQRQLRIPEIDDTEYKVGYGLTVASAGHVVRVGAFNYLRVRTPLLLESRAQRFEVEQLMLASDGFRPNHTTSTSSSSSLLSYSFPDRRCRSALVGSLDRESQRHSARHPHGQTQSSSDVLICLCQHEVAAPIAGRVFGPDPIAPRINSAPSLFQYVKLSRSVSPFSRDVAAMASRDVASACWATRTACAGSRVCGSRQCAKNQARLSSTK